jgi:hypothetical protein
MEKNKVVAYLPKTVPIATRAAANALRIDVRIHGSKAGSLSIGSGSVAWWPDYKSVKAHRISWPKFIEMMEKMPQRRAAKKLKKSS